MTRSSPDTSTVSLVELTEWFNNLDFDRSNPATRHAEYAELLRIVGPAQASPCPVCHNPYRLEGAERYWEARWRAEKANNDALVKALADINFDIKPELCASELELIAWWGRQVDRLQSIAREALSEVNNGR